MTAEFVPRVMPSIAPPSILTLVELKLFAVTPPPSAIDIAASPSVNCIAGVFIAVVAVIFTPEGAVRVVVPAFKSASVAINALKALLTLLGAIPSDMSIDLISVLFASVASNCVMLFFAIYLAPSRLLLTSLIGSNRPCC